VRDLNINSNFYARPKSVVEYNLLLDEESLSKSQSLASAVNFNFYCSALRAHSLEALFRKKPSRFSRKPCSKRQMSYCQVI